MTSPPLDDDASKLREQAWLADEYAEIIAVMAGGQWPEALSRKQRIIAILVSRDLPIPDDLHEAALRQALAENPDDVGLAFSLVSLLLRLDRPPLPDAPAPTSAPREGMAHEVDSHLRQASAHHLAGEYTRTLASLWCAASIAPHDLRSWALHALVFAENGQWPMARIAFDRGAQLAKSSSVAGLANLGQALQRLAEAGHSTADECLRLAQLLASAGEIGRHASAVAPSPAGDVTASHLWRLGGDVGKALEAAYRPRRHDHLRAGDAPAALAEFLARFAADDDRGAHDCLRAAIVADPVHAVHEIVRSYSGEVETLYFRIGGEDTIADWLTAHHDASSDITLVPSFQSRESAMAASRMRAEAMDRGLPSALVVTQPKSASVSIAGIFGGGFRLPTVLYSFLRGRVVLPWALDFARGGGFFVRHLNPTARNIALLGEAGLDRVIVQVRDPRAQFLSMIHHLDRYPRYNTPAVNARWPSLSFDERFDLVADLLLDHEMVWLQGWIEARGSLDVRFVTFEEFIRNKERFVERLLAMYGGDTRHFDPKAAVADNPKVDNHFRSGTTDEWQKAFSARQIERITRAMPSECWSLFEWPA